MLGRRAGHAASGATAIAAFAGYFSLLERRWPIPTTREALRIGACWVLADYDAFRELHRR